MHHFHTKMLCAEANVKTMESYQMVYSRKKKQGVEKMEFPGVLKKWEVDFPGVN